jgi:alanine racemase
MNDSHQLAIFEAGISQPDEMQKLALIIQPEIGIFTNIGSAHSENFKSLEEKIREKLLLFKKAKRIILRQNTLIDNVLKNTFLNEECQPFTWSRQPGSDLWIKNVRKFRNVTQLTVIYQDRETKISIPFTDLASMENAMHCFATLLVLNYPIEEAASRLQYLHPLSMRLELKEGINHCSIINDSYSSDINSLAVGIDFLNQQKQHPQKTVIISDILQSGKTNEELYSEVATLLYRKHINRVIGIGTAISQQQEKFRMEKKFFPDTETFLQEFSVNHFQNEAILLKGARIFGFEKINSILQQKAHETVLEINLNALVHNLNYYRSQLTNGTKIMAMVKAFSYGSGSYEIAGALQFHHADYLTVAYADEGIELRKAGITLPILVMNPENHAIDAMLVNKLEPEVYNFKTLDMIEKALKNSPDVTIVHIHVKLDTGMHRLGFCVGELEQLIERIKNNKRIIIKSIFSHLAAADDTEEDTFTHSQITVFSEMSNLIQQQFDYKILLHILNSAGITRFPDAQFDMVRLGIGLYGIASVSEDEKYLKNVNTLKTIISQIKKVPKGETVGYNRRWKATKESKIATIPIGYADGLNRRLGNGKGFLLINNQLAPIIGNICMDMCMLDISHIEAKEGDEVIVFGEKNSITKLAKAMDTIPYEILTAISRRVKRIYIQE